MAGRCWLAVAVKAALVSQFLMSDTDPRFSELFLKKKQDFDRVKQEGKRCQTSLFNVVFCSSVAGDTRVGIVVGRRFGKAVVRNRGKRMVREVIRKTYCLLVKGYHIIVFPKQSVLTSPYQAFYASWVQVLTREGLLCSTDSIPFVK